MSEYVFCTLLRWNDLSALKYNQQKIYKMMPFMEEYFPFPGFILRNKNTIRRCSASSSILQTLLACVEAQESVCFYLPSEIIKYPNWCNCEFAVKSSMWTLKDCSYFNSPSNTAIYSCYYQFVLPSYKESALSYSMAEYTQSWGIYRE